ncbi:MAG TPA: sigma-70 family RNA polymerase sigma factor [Blastocatellia bacterium]|nr:sigma-70 family RNA polymerase sigma factor [Blastocatellia bacterium]
MGEKGKVLTEEALSALIAQARAGQTSAWDEIFVFLRARISALAKYRIGTDYEDVVQETLMTVYEHLNELRDAEHLLMFATKVLRNKIGNFYQKQERQSRYLEGQRRRHPIYNPYELWDLQESVKILAHALDRLGQRRPQCRDLLLGLADGASIEELCEEFDIPPTRIHYRIFRCRRALRSILVNEFGVSVQNAHLVLVPMDDPRIVQPATPFYEVDDEGQ